MDRKITFYKYTFLILSVLILVLCVYKVFAMKEVYGKDLVVYDTKPIRKLEPQFLKEIDNPLEPEPMFFQPETKCHVLK